MKLLDLLLYHARQINQTGEELRDTPNKRDFGARFKELRGYYILLGQVLERLENEHFRTSPLFGAKRAQIRQKQLDEPSETE